MNIRTRVRLAALLPALFALLIGAALWISWVQVDQVRQRAETADQIRRGVSDLNILTQEYLLYGSARAVAQLHKNHLSLQKLLAAASFPEPEEREMLESIRQGHTDLDRLVMLLLQGHVGSHEQIASALLVKVQDVRFKAQQLSLRQHEQVVTIQHRVDTLVLLALGILALLSVTLLALLGRRLIQGMDQLGEGMRRAESGDLNHEVPVASTDELGALARTFNDMTRRLRESTTSIDLLQHEIGEREQAEQALHESEAALKAAQHLAGLGNWAWDIPSDRHAWSEEIYRIYGRDPALPPAVYPDVQQYFTPESWAQLATAVERGLATGEAYECDAEVVHPDGSHRWIVARGEATRDAGGKVVNLHGTVQDITERKRAEDEIRRLNADLERRVAERTAELTAANHELDSFAYAVSHDLRAPLRAMSGFSQALIEDYGTQLQGDAKVYLEQIDLASHKMNELIDGLLVLSRCTRGELQYDAVDLSAMAESQLAELAQSEPERNVTLKVETGLQTHGDMRMIEVVMRNLLGNAWKYSAHVAAPLAAEIRVYREERDGQIFFCVADNGAGFDMAHANRLFQPFQRLHRQEEFPGIGIGLATVQRIVHRHGGNIDARGEPGKGAVFCFCLATAKEAG